ncbi:MAG TPA: multicopper oxidase domain-containing protein, partial [Gemmatimonadales bacterium]|nr:multicopper oxidase domain-containing protein [Gemmatimonadales bacterium]
MVPLPRPRIRAGRVATLAIAVAACAAPPPPDAASAPDLPLAHLNDLRRPAGRMAGDTLVLELDLVRAAWTPRGGTGPRVAVPVFAEAGGAPSVPGPLLRVSAGTPVRLTVRNTLDAEAEIRVPAIEGLGRDSLVLAPGATRSLAWTPATAVSSAYGARVDGERGPNGPTMGVLVVDPPGTLPHPGERILLLTSWGSPAEPGSLSPESSWKMTVNGRSWPFTERFTFAVGDTVRWRVINTSFTRHPMHLHGFYFDVTSAGDLEADTAYAPGSRSPVVTHTMLNLSAMTLSWVPTTPGNWLFHCHLLRHMGANQRFAAESAHAHAGSDAVMAMDDGMAGLITGITVEPAAGAEPAEPPPARRIDLWTGATPGGWGDAPRLALVRQDGAEPPAPDSTVAPSSLLVLRRDEPVEIVVHNRLETPLAVHWHGLELRSVYDGVGHWSG